MFRVRQVMSAPVATVRGETTVDETIELMLRLKISGLPVVDDEQRVVGVVSEFDLLRLMYDHVPGGEPVRRFVTKNVLAVEEDASLVDVVDLFLSRSLRRLPVVREGKLVGIVSRRDLIRFIRNTRTQANELRAAASV